MVRGACRCERSEANDEDEAEAEMKRLSVAFFAMDRARADKIDPSEMWLALLDAPALNPRRSEA